MMRMKVSAMTTVMTMMMTGAAAEAVDARCHGDDLMRTSTPVGGLLKDFVSLEQRTPLYQSTN